MYWGAESVFGGINVSIQAIEQGLGIFFLELEHSRKFESAKEEYEADLDILKEKFGNPADVGEDNGYPWARWKWGDVCLNLALAERFMDYVALSVSKGVIE